MKKRKNISVFVISAVVLAAVVYLIVHLAPGSTNTPQVILPPEPTTSPVQTNPSSSGSGNDQANVGPGTVQAVIRTISPAVSYSRTLTAHSFWQGGESSSILTVYARANQLRITEQSDFDTRNILIDGKSLSLWYGDGSTGVFHGAAAAYDASRLQRMVSIDRILTLPEASITGAGYEDLSGEPCVWLTFTDNDLPGTTEKAYISVNTGLLMGNDSWQGDVQTFSLRSDPVDTESVPADENFAAPGNNEP
ncbi:MAG: hypothetical protein FWC62_03705 [Firmicutes bacterium]|nr:hypothetical protein [Bacillota bacterium]